ncbi:hypothetical protein BJ170DRAFT_594894 [Xylariales sp. AK1849]|nr:hypothetical protein BJ170DRAFT_594894 [Xylariales sp. AK1849]
MSDSSDSDYPSGNDRVSGTYHRTSPRARPDPQSQLAGESAGLRPYRPNQTTLISEYRNRATSTRPPRVRLTSHWSPPTHATSSVARVSTGQGSSRTGEFPPSRRHREQHPVGSSVKHAGHAVRDFLHMKSKLVEPVDSSLPLYADNESFFPHPKVTFMIDRPENVKCSICTETPLKLTSSSTQTDEDVVMMLPCGHSACAYCMKAWLQEHNSCPFCRVEHIHEGCGHAVEPKSLVYETIMSLPPTTAAGGKVGRNCAECHDKLRLTDLPKQLQSLASKFQRARAAAHEAKLEVARSGSAAAKNAKEALVKAMNRTRDKWERCVLDTDYEQDIKSHKFCMYSIWIRESK